MTISNQASGLRSGVCSSTTRPTTPYEGQMIYETDTDMVAIWNGSAWRYIAATTPTNGTVLQVQTASLTGTVSMATTTWTTLTNLSAQITPRSSSSKVLVTVNIHAYSTTSNGAGNSGCGVRLLRNGSLILQPGPADGSGFYMQYSSSGGNLAAVLTMQHLDTPNTTSVLTYSLQGNSYSNSITTFFNSDGGTNAARCTFTLMEIAA